MRVIAGEARGRRLEALPGTGRHKKVILPGNHALDTARLELARVVGTWIEEMVKGTVA